MSNSVCGTVLKVPAFIDAGCVRINFCAMSPELPAHAMHAIVVGKFNTTSRGH